MKNKVTITSEYDGCEIQRYLRRELLMSSVMVKRLKLYGTVNLNGVHARIRDRISEGDELFIEYE
ncbi:MAG: RluA family pseudouridine synthase, partial [Saccharofermentans sp.]|nr:RluA family pseudouridine synthase [Saccharofermentans sp.]